MTTAVTEARSPVREPQAPPDHRQHARRWWILAVVGLAQLMVVLDASVVNIALPSAQRDLGFSDDARQWVVTAYALAFGSLLLLGGRLSDLFGRRLTFLVGLVGFAVASAVGGASVNFAMLVAARAAQGLFGALLAPAALALLTTTFVDPKERGKAFGIFGAIAGAGGAVGLLLGGVLTEYLDWRWCMYVNLVFAAVTIIGGALLLRRPAEAETRPKLDLPGTLVVSAALFCIVFGFANVPSDGWGSPMSWAFFVAGGVLLALFVVLQSKVVSHPLLPMRVLLHRTRGGSYLAVFLVGIGMFGIFLFLTYFLQLNLRFSPVTSGVAFLPMIGALVLASTTTSTLLLPRIGPRPLIPAGMIIAAGGLLWLTQLRVDSTYAGDVLVPLLIIGVGLGLSMAPAMNSAVVGVEEHDAGVASATVNTAMQVGGSIGTALLSTVAANAITSYLSTRVPSPLTVAEATVHSYTTAFGWAAAIFAGGAIVCGLILRNSQALTRPVPAGAPAAGTEPAGTAAVPASAVPAATVAAPAQPAPARPVTAAPVATPAGEPVTGPELHGRVSRPHGGPVVGATVTLIDNVGRQLAQTATDTDGGYRLRAPAAGSYVLITAAPAHLPEAAAVTFGNTPATFDVVLRGAAGLRGAVCDEATGQPIAGALAILTDDRGEVVAAATTDAAGRYEFSAVVPGGYTLAVSHAGHQPVAQALLVSDGGNADRDVTLVPIVGGVFGTVLSPQRTPVHQAMVSLQDAAGRTVRRTITDTDGGYRFEDLAAGEYLVIASGFAPTSRVITLDRQDCRYDLELGHPPGA